MAQSLKLDRSKPKTKFNSTWTSCPDITVIHHDVHRKESTQESKEGRSIRC